MKRMVEKHSIYSLGSGQFSLSAIFSLSAFFTRQKVHFRCLSAFFMISRSLSARISLSAPKSTSVHSKTDTYAFLVKKTKKYSRLARGIRLAKCTFQHMSYFTFSRVTGATVVRLMRYWWRWKA